MVDQDDDLGLSLALKCPQAQPQRPLNLFVQKKFLSNDAFHASETRAYLRGIDVNRAPPAIADCEDVGVSSPNSTISSISGKRNDRETNDEENENENEIDSSEEDAGGNGDTVRKKLRLSKEQSAILEETFKEHNTLNPKQKLALAKRLNLRPRQVEVWFQNRRARTKLKQTEVDCEYLKRCCENLTDENRRLQKEVQELRTLKLSPQLYMHMSPPTTLTMCPSCERVAVTSSSSTTPAAVPAPAPAPTSATPHFSLAPHQRRSMPISAPWAGGGGAVASSSSSSMRHRPLDPHGTRS